MKSEHEIDLNKYKNRAKELHKYLIKMFKEVVNPLKTEVRIRDELAKRLQGEAVIIKKDLKLLSSCLRLPAMCDQF